MESQTRASDEVMLDSMNVFCLLLFYLLTVEPGEIYKSIGDVICVEVTTEVSWSVTSYRLCIAV